MFEKGLPWKKQLDLCSRHAQAFSCFNRDKSASIVSPLLKQEIHERAVFYGGSFNPWHEGHRACLDLCPDSPIIVVPDYNPWKDLKAREEGPWDLIVDLYHELAGSPYSIYPGFLTCENVTPTVDWLPKINLENKYFLLGEDNFLKIHLWKNYQDLLNNLKGLYVCPRAADQKEIEIQSHRLRRDFPQLTISFQSHHDYEYYSSTHLRNKKN